MTVVASRWAGPNADTQKAIVESYTNGTIVIDDVDYNNLKEKQILSMSASGEYDLVWVPEVWIPEYVANGWLLPLDSYIGLPLMQGQAAMDLYAMILYSNGGDYFDADGSLALTSDVCLEAAQQYAELVQYAMDGAVTWHNDQVSEAIRTGKCPFGITMSGLSGLDSDPEGSVIADCVAYGAMPGKKSVSGCLNTWSWAIAANSANPDAAWEAVKYLTSADVEKQMAVQIGILPQLPRCRPTLMFSRRNPSSPRCPSRWRTARRSLWLPAQAHCPTRCRPHSLRSQPPVPIRSRCSTSSRTIWRIPSN